MNRIGRRKEEIGKQARVELSKDKDQEYFRYCKKKDHDFFKDCHIKMPAISSISADMYRD